MKEVGTAVERDEPRRATGDRARRMRLAEEAYERFADVVGTLGELDWARPTDCAAWTVRDLVGHVLGAMRAAASTRETVSQLREIKRRVREHGGNETDTMTQVQIERTASLSNAALQAEIRSLTHRAARGRRRTPAPMRRWARLAVEMGEIRETWTIGYLMDVILTRDAWLHRIDLCRALGVEPTLTAAHDGAIVADVATEWMQRHGGAVELVLTGPVGGRFEAGADPRARIELDAVEFCRILSGRTSGEGLLAVPVPF